MEETSVSESPVVAETVAAVQEPTAVPQSAYGRAIKGAMSVLDGVAITVLTLTFIGELGITLADVFTRTFLDFSISWTLEASSTALIVIAFVGGARSYGQGSQISVRLLVDRTSGATAAIFECLGDWLALAAALIVGVTSLRDVLHAGPESTPILHIPLWTYTLTIIIGMGFVGLYALLHIALIRPFGSVLISAVIAAAAVLLTLEPAMTEHHLDGKVILIVAGVWAVACVVCGVSLTFTFILSSAAYIAGGGQFPISVIGINMYEGVNSYVLLSIPFFVFAGLVMSEGGISQKLARLANSVVGRSRGGLLQSSILGMILFSGISGVKVADIAAVGSAIAPELEEGGYEAEEAAAVLSASAAMGDTIPPSVVLLILASITTLSPIKLFEAGIFPALVLAIGLAIMVRLRSKQRGKPTSLRQFANALVSAIPGLLIPLVLFIGLTAGFTTPTEVASLAVLYAMLLTTLAYRSLSLKQLASVIGATATLSGLVLFLISGGQAFTYMLTLTNAPQNVSDFMSGLGDKWLLLLATVIILPIFGAILEGMPAILIFAPVLLPAAEHYGINPLQYGILLVLTLANGAFFPPFGVGFYAACAVFHASPGKAARRMVPYVAVLFVGTLLIAAIPDITTVVPKLFGDG